MIHRPTNPGTVRRGVLVGIDGAGDSRTTLELAFSQASVHVELEPARGHPADCLVQGGARMNMIVRGSAPRECGLRGRVGFHGRDSADVRRFSPRRARERMGA